ncbi:MAG: hypothetical protein ACRERE_32445 [Candidatus Entotheonellia bacterium]
MKIVEQFCRFFCNLVGWQLPGKPVLLRIDDTDHHALWGIVIKGAICDVISGIRTTGPGGSNWSDDPFAIIHLDSPLNFNGENIEWLMAVPRHKGYGLYRLCMTWIAVYIHVLERPTPPQEISWSDINAVCSMKLIK